VLILKLIGSRVNIGPVAARVGMLFWSWLWGGIGLLPVAPLTAFVKLVADCHAALLPIPDSISRKAGHGAALGPSKRRDCDAGDSIFTQPISSGSEAVTKVLYLFRSMFDFPSS
jgi:hypothetical protein